MASPPLPSERQNQQQQFVGSDSVDEEIVSEGLSRLSTDQEVITTVYDIPDIFTEWPPIRDALETSTSRIQDEVVESCLPFMKGEGEDFAYGDNGVPRLLRAKHVSFLRNSLRKLSPRFVTADASRPWFMYWCLNGLAILGEDVASYRHAVVETARSMQNETGGFGGGGKQLSHLATTYATVLSLAIVGGEDAFEVVDRRAMWKWLCALKQPDGGFQVCLGGEEDVRGAYCAAVIITLLNIPLDLSPESSAWAWADTQHPTLFTGLADYVHRCQTFEGGISAHPDSEAHGAYAFCALGCLSMMGHPDQIIHKYLDIPRLIFWLSSRQYAPEGGFSGRTNKLVDGCYSHWVGGCFPLIEACLRSRSSSRSPPAATGEEDLHAQKLPPVSESLFSRDGLIRYILCCCQDQSKRGGLRDKPGKSSDPYHTCYVLSGLSSAQHRWELAYSETEPATGGGPDAVWTVQPYLDGVQIFDNKDWLRPVHPVYAIPPASQAAIRSYFLAKEGF